MRFHIIRNTRIENIGKYQSCIVSKLRIIWKQTVRACTGTALSSLFLSALCSSLLLFLPPDSLAVLSLVCVHSRACCSCFPLPLPSICPVRTELSDLLFYSHTEVARWGRPPPPPPPSPKPVTTCAYELPGKLLCDSHGYIQMTCADAARRSAKGCEAHGCEGEETTCHNTTSGGPCTLFMHHVCLSLSFSVSVCSRTEPRLSPGCLAVQYYGRICMYVFTINHL